LRRKDKQEIDPKRLEDIIARASILRMALFDEPFPYLVPVHFGYHQGKFYVHSACEGKKIQLLQKNNRICFELEADSELIRGASPCTWSTRYESVIGFGRASFIEGTEKKRRGLEIVFRHYSPDPFEIPEASLETVVVIEIEVEAVTAKVSGRPVREGQR
jgi:hypothetical protein